MTATGVAALTTVDLLAARPVRPLAASARWYTSRTQRA